MFWKMRGWLELMQDLFIYCEEVFFYGDWMGVSWKESVYVQ
jgi:hypothetical protein